MRLAATWKAILCGSLSMSYAGTIEDIKARGAVLCAVQDKSMPYSRRESDGQWQGLSIDFCRALATAILKDGKRVKFVQVVPEDAIATLQAEEADVVLIDAAWNTTAEVNHWLVGVAPLWLQTDGKRGVWIIVRQGDESWGLAIKLVLATLLKAGSPVSTTDQDDLVAAGVTLGLNAQWHQDVIKGSGSYAAIVERHLGKDTARGPNALFSEGGVHVFP